MKQTLIIGSTVVDVIIRMPHLPTTAEDVNVLSQVQRLGGCAYNASSMLHLEGVPYTLCSPVGKGMYGDFVKSALQNKGLKPFVVLPDIENGCCYCFVEDGGERTFLSHHGAEYLFSRDWMKKLDASTIDRVYVCGIELEETTSEEIVLYLEENPHFKVFFAPGPRIAHIKKDFIDRILALKPILHLNEQEALYCSGKTDIEEAAKTLHDITGKAVVITLGERGALLIEEGVHYIEGIKADVVDTIGAGDCHAGAILAGIQTGLSLQESVKRANVFSSGVVSVQGATLSQEQYAALCTKMENNYEK